MKRSPECRGGTGGAKGPPVKYLLILLHMHVMETPAGTFNKKENRSIWGTSAAVHVCSTEMLDPDASTLL